MIGILGGYGKVGLQTTKVLTEWGGCPLRIGGRNPEKAQLKFSSQFPAAELVKVDIGDDDSLRNFIGGCELIINCAGPSHRITSRVAQMSTSCECHHIDAGEGKQIKNTYGTSKKTAILYSAGAFPGLSGLLPRWLANSFESVTNLTMYVGGLDRFTFSGAEDYLFGVFNEAKEPLAAWREGACRPLSLKRSSGATLPFFLSVVELHPFYDAETEFVAKSLSLRNGEWYMAIDGEHMIAALEGISGKFYTDPEDAIAQLCRATELDTAGRQTYLIYLVQLEGIQQGKSLTRTLVARAADSFALTGSVAAVTGIALLAGELPINVGPIAEIPHPEKVIAGLSDVQVLTQFQVFDCSIKDLLQTTEGKL
ncbi:NAD(P)H-binding protein [uncultured Desulfobacter sp.]|uniref:NAD(P)H-binding protein n=1 Tax=uncultured Desulfobacter sp. TaxID=240139 RepID=UPI0029C840A6|nr:NAD(P)H-binding protein [uncultured Desulfobacter sp.]